MKNMIVSPDVMKKMPKTRRATFWESVWNRLTGKLLWWLMEDK